MFAREAVKLIKELDQSEDITPFNEATFREVLEEIDLLARENGKAVKEINESNELVSSQSGDTEIIDKRNSELKNSILLRHYSIERNKRCLLTYLYHRMKRLRQARWELGSILPAEINDNLLDPEMVWFRSYNKSLASYMKTIGEDGLNILNDIHPPKSLYIEVRCTQNYGKFEFDDGQVINLQENTYHLLPKAQCEALIRQGILEHVSS